jgi:adenine-specific DNA-methyltransferase
MVQIKKDSKFNPNVDSILFNGDCLDLLSTIPDDFVKLIVTSPPYNLDKVYENKMEMKEYIKGQGKVIKECFRILDDNGSICWQVGNYVDNGEITPLDIVLYPIFKSLGLHLRNRIIWHFGHGLHASKRFSGRYETIIWFTKTDDYTFNLDPVRVPQKYPGKKHFKGPNKGKLSCNPMGKNPSDIWEIPNVKSNHVEKTVHPCQFPVELIERLVLSMTNEGDWVFDPFMGVGSTAIASLINGRKSIGAEIMTDYIKIAENRISLAEKGSLKIRPMERNVFDPNQPNNIPPKTATIKRTSNSAQTKLDNSIKGQ